MIGPNFFIVGAPKCGTTALYHYLKQHPEIYLPGEKELHFFGSDLDLRVNRPNRSQYLSLFADAKDEKRVGEASVWYLYSKNAAAEIKEFNPSAAIIIMLRNPVDMLYSLHSQFLYNGNENISDFRSALDAENDRKRGLRIPGSVIHVAGLFYRETVKYAEQVERYFRIFGKENVHVIIYDDFARDTAAAYRNTCDFLGVANDFTPHMRVINPNKKVRSTVLRRFLTRPPSWSRKVGSLLIPRRHVRDSLKKTLSQFNTQYTSRAPMEAELRRILAREFIPEMEKLSMLLDKDLSRWCRNG